MDLLVFQRDYINVMYANFNLTVSNVRVNSQYFRLHRLTITCYGLIHTHARGRSVGQRDTRDDRDIVSVSAQVIAP